MTKTLLVPCTILLLGISGTAAAKDNSDVIGESPLVGLYECAEISLDSERLACFDTIAASLKVKEEKKEIVAIDADKVKTIKKEAFGFNLPSLPKLGLPSIGGDEKTPSIKLAVKSVRTVNRKYVFVMENGQVWKQSKGHLNYVPKGDLTATIKKGALGSFKLSLSNGKTSVRGVGVKRVS